MYPDDGDLEQRLARFEAQLDRFNLALHQWQHTQEHGQPAGPRDVDQRLRTLEDTIDREAQAVRHLHEEPLKQLQEQAAILKEICAAAANSVSGLDRAEARLAAMQADVQAHFGELTRSLHAFVADLRLGAGHPTALSTQGSAAAWPLERVVHLHDELRRSANGTDASVTPGVMPSGGDAPGRMQVFEHGGGDGDPASASWNAAHRNWYIAIGLVVAAGLLVFGLLRRIETRLDDAGVRMTAAERQAEAATQIANREVVAARREADKEIAEARQSAQRAETIGAVLSAPDLVRFNLAGGTTERSSAQVLWSRTRGLVLSASRLPPAPPDTTYQLWLTTSAEPVSGGLFVPVKDALAGRERREVEEPAARAAFPSQGPSLTLGAPLYSGECHGEPLVTRVTNGSGHDLRFESSRVRHYRKLKIYVPDADNSTQTINIQYTVSDALRFFEDHDELYWNITGDEWDVPIGNATATIILPVDAKNIRANAHAPMIAQCLRDARADQIFPP
jgi:hypothetical protein